MASLSFPHFLSFQRCSSNRPNYSFPYLNVVQLQDFRFQKKWSLSVTSKKKIAESVAQEDEVVNEKEEAAEKKTSRTRKRATPRAKKKAIQNSEQENSELLAVNDSSNDESSISASTKESKKTPRKTTRRAASNSTSTEEDKTTEKKVKRGRKAKKKSDDIDHQLSESKVNDNEESTFLTNIETEKEEDSDLDIGDGEDISDTYSWPPLVCCFGAAQHAFVPSGRPANRLTDYEIHESKKDALWAPEKFVRAPGGSAGSIAIALASLGGRVAFMGKLGDDEYGQAILYYMNVNNVQTRSVKVDSKKLTALSQMKIGKRGRLRMTCVKPCAEDSLSKSEINTDVLKEAKIFYFNTHSLLDQNMRLTTLKAIKISKKLGGVIFYDVNLPLPLWQSHDETKLLLEQVWNLADIIEITKQELEFLTGIEPAEEFDTKNNDVSKFIHYDREVIAPIWHKNLKVLFVTNGTSKVHYYTEEHDGSILGMEDPPITPFTCDMSASGDGIVAGLLRMLAVQPELTLDKPYLERTINYAIQCGVIDQWILGRTRGYPPKDDMEENVVPDENGIRSITERKFRTLEPVSLTF